MPDYHITESATDSTTVYSSGRVEIGHRRWISTSTGGNDINGPSDTGVFYARTIYSTDSLPTISSLTDIIIAWIIIV